MYSGVSGVFAPQYILPYTALHTPPTFSYFLQRALTRRDYTNKSTMPRGPELDPETRSRICELKFTCK